MTSFRFCMPNGGFSIGGGDETKPGIKLGTGIELTKLYLKVEFVNVFTEGDDLSFIPFTVGLKM